MAILPSPATIAVAMAVMVLLANNVAASDSNRVFSPCSDARVEISDGFTFGIVFGTRSSLGNGNNTQFSPCDSRLNLANSNSQIATFRPKVDEISILSINTSSFSPDTIGGYMVAFAGRKYAARSLLAFVANGTYTVTSFTLVLEFQKGRLQNLFWKRDGCAKCKGSSNYVCLNKQDCAIRTSSCAKTNSNGSDKVDCSLGIQLAFSGTDKHLSPLNSWYEVEKLRQYSLYGLYENLKNSLTSQYNSVFS